METFNIILNEDINIFNEDPQKIKSITIERIKEIIKASNSPYTIKEAVNEFFEDPEYLDREPERASKELYETLIDVANAHKKLVKDFEERLRNKDYARIVSYISNESLDDYEDYKSNKKINGVFSGTIGGFLASRIIKSFIKNSKMSKGKKMLAGTAQTVGSTIAGGVVGSTVSGLTAKRKFNNGRKVLEDEEVIRLLPKFVNAFKIMGNKYENVAKQLKSKYDIKHESFLLENNIYW